MIDTIRTGDAQLLPMPFRLVHLADGQVLMTRLLRAIDAERYNQVWRERGIPTRWERQPAA
ncbi:MAG: hypothetical protein RMM29_06740 [Planctomycetota bacterium]|nr:hypothetical protein [Planctomycetota bacterium]MCX8039398.1 hypothetical protein [Planctomycetota bacterium]MDW8373326.1 hypothetical protein [Planctomycetota bacterium]